MVEKQHSSDYKLSAIKDYEKTGNFTETCRVFDCKRQSLKRWYSNYKKNKSLTRKARKQGSYKVNNELVKYAKMRVKEKPDIFIVDLLSEIKGEFPDITISRQHLGELLRDNNKTRKRLRHIHEPTLFWGKERNHKKEVIDYINEVKEYDINKIIALDETGIYASLHGTYGRCDLGKRCSYKTTDNKVFKKYSLLVAINTKGVIGWKLYEEGAVNSERLTSFIKENITSQFEDNLLIMDNAGFHKTKEVKEEINKMNDFIYTVSYYPRSNPIENFFSKLKYSIRKESPLSYNAIHKTIEKAIDNMKEKEFRNYFAYAFDKDAVKKVYKKDSTLRRKGKIYKN
jgi:transposase